MNPKTATQPFRPSPGENNNKKGKCSYSVSNAVRTLAVVRLKGLEPTRIAAREPKGDVTLVKLCTQCEFNFPIMKNAISSPIIAPGMYPRTSPPPTQINTMMICIRQPISIPSYHKTVVAKVDPLFFEINTHLIDFVKLAQLNTGLDFKWIKISQDMFNLGSFLIKILHIFFRLSIALLL